MQVDVTIKLLNSDREMPEMDGPFIAHGLGTFAGAILTYMIAVNYKTKLAMLIGFFLLIGGITNVFILPSPTWFIVLDLVGAYLPMAWLGTKLVSKMN